MQPTEELGEAQVSPVDELSYEPGTIEEFEYKRNKLVEMMQADPDVRDKLLAEVYLNISNMEAGIRGAFQLLQNEGMSGMLKGMIGRRKG